MEEVDGSGRRPGESAGHRTVDGGEVRDRLYVLFISSVLRLSYGICSVNIGSVNNSISINSTEYSHLKNQYHSPGTYTAGSVVILRSVLTA